MRCPSCNSDRVGSGSTCAQCGALLLQPDEVESGGAPGWVPVFATPDPAALAIAKSILMGADIQYVVAGESLQDVIGGGRIGGLNLVTGPVQLSVPAEQADVARELLAELDG